MKKQQILSRISTNQKRVALTFDIANGHEVPLRMLPLLQKLGVKKATFFITGIWAEEHPKIAKRIRREGYEIGSHGYRHQDYRAHNNTWIKNEVKLAQNAIVRATGVWPCLFRTPGGDMDHRVIKKLQLLNQTIVHWDVDSLDWKLTRISTIVNRVVPHTRPGSIVLLHANDPWHQSLKAVPIIVRRLRRKGYRFATVSELLRQR
ncbi:polysaccharide deacetylase family protein [Paenibacillus sp. ACRSA]|uniref:polysaccharide deacetylase family protein n=1 Tax=Paenibacillus sp. ACRSA TaxID=2918211 RepID=UPI001EF61A78|nr:polysaccharide deacetylase family protein [Paenibacillus sp. ACRSA]MCG7380490.1 polysaccharide deacetylase family protein [Paenibacillus sp. ACRSA]